MLGWPERKKEPRWCEGFSPAGLLFCPEGAGYGEPLKITRDQLTRI